MAQSLAKILLYTVLLGTDAFLGGTHHQQILTFYRAGDEAPDAVRLMHGARNLPRRLREPPS
jgi:hypothetical protein